MNQLAVLSMFSLDAIGKVYGRQATINHHELKRKQLFWGSSYMGGRNLVKNTYID